MALKPEYSRRDRVTYTTLEPQQPRSRIADDHLASTGSLFKKKAIMEEIKQNQKTPSEPLDLANPEDTWAGINIKTTMDQSTMDGEDQEGREQNACPQREVWAGGGGTRGK